MDSIIKGGEIVTAGDNYTADLGIEGGKIKLIGKDLSPDKGTEIIEAEAIQRAISQKYPTACRVLS